MAEQSTLASPPYDTISSLHFSPTTPNHLLVSSWDATVRLYDTATTEQTQVQKSKFDHRAAVLDCCFSADGKLAYSAGLDNTVRAMDLTSEKLSNLGLHNQAVSSILYSQSTNSVVTGSWDRSLKVWDPRTNASHSTYNTRERVYHLASPSSTSPSTISTGQGSNAHMIVVAQASRLFDIYDLRKMDKPVYERESSLKFMTRSLACMANGDGFAIGSVEGRIAVEYFDPNSATQEKKYAFKCHRQAIDNVDHVWPVNALAFHPIYNTFASGGSDGALSVWDHEVKKRLRQYPKYSSPISALSFNVDGSKLAVAVGYTWDDGKDGASKAEQPAIFIRDVGDGVKPKGWA
ncbi:WD40-repeat-containing domain protein [Pterulicium gracile]|uniref:WD40-repeat-containing domain protein n=1 Tax=Pterulicium gracile TaxID=1884261 RepID=A0A5C3QV01_9AGAR|nr:WD40-repeat-containing domain protein [Pterula gracilis]